MNLLHDDIEDIAERVKLKILARGQLRVYVGGQGAVASYSGVAL